ncbi:hypothetical protein JAAARDRAFT_201272 [Jaapia argillacea MUCL 33604]|uniref:Uncharacterized protein n=1 Tax=Jaapia argillacea MUCL 33604 TaxID=933084 RepID=A0A067P231_9AGAM|nr:hypothetical protein JAAARDRAFT_201272 [Jaapia argillacea MUCL 33604]
MSDARATSVGAQSDAAMSDGAPLEATTDFTTADQSDTEGMYNHVLMAKEKAKITAYQACLLIHEKDTDKACVYLNGTRSIACLNCRKLHRGCTNNNTITKFLLTAEELEELTVQVRRSTCKTQKSRKMTQEASTPPPPKMQPMALATSPIARTGVLMEIPRAAFPIAEVPLLPGATPSHIVEVPTVVEGTPTLQAEFPPVTGGTPEGT